MLENYIISLATSHTRRQHIFSQFNSKSIPFSFFDAISSSEQLNSATTRLLPLFSEVDYLSLGEKGCFMSHISLWQHCLDQNLPYIGIFEDDIWLGEQANKFLTNDSWLQEFFPINEPFIIRLETVYEPCQIKSMPRNSYHNHQIYKLCSPHHGTGGYIISQVAIKWLLSYLRNTHLDDFTPIDVLMFEHLIPHTKINVYQLNPAICIQEAILHPQESSLGSQIEVERSKKNPHISKRKLPQKIKREITRLKKQILRHINRRIPYQVIPFK